MPEREMTEEEAKKLTGRSVDADDAALESIEALSTAPRTRAHTVESGHDAASASSEGSGLQQRVGSQVRGRSRTREITTAPPQYRDSRKSPCKQTTDQAKSIVSANKQGLLNALLALGALMMLLSSYVVYRLHQIDAFKPLERHNATISDCVALRGFHGLEDGQMITGTDVALFAGHKGQYVRALKGQSTSLKARLEAMPTMHSHIVRLNLSTALTPLDYQLEQCELADWPNGMHFHAQGMYVLGRRLFVINHTPNHDQIEVFDASHATDTPNDASDESKGKCSVQYRTSLHHPLFKNLNDVATVRDAEGRLHLFITVDAHHVDDTWRKRAERYLSLSTAQLLHCIVVQPHANSKSTAKASGKSGPFDMIETQCEIALNGLSYANGVAVSRDAKFLYVTESAARHVAVYQIVQLGQPNLHDSQMRFAPDETTPSVPAVLQHYHDVPLRFFCPDNIDVDQEDGSLIIAGHPNALQYLRHADSFGQPDQAPSPSMVVRVRVMDEAIADKHAAMKQPQEAQKDEKKWFERMKRSTYEVEHLYSAYDDQLSASSVGVAHKDKLVIGSIFADGVLVCPLRPATGPKFDSAEDKQKMEQQDKSTSTE